jgi:hypothetical protein
MQVTGFTCLRKEQKMTHARHFYGMVNRMSGETLPKKSARTR